MKLIWVLSLLIITTTAHAESALETDDNFFKSAVAPYEDDDLDRTHKKNELQKSVEREKKIDSHVKEEFSSTRQGIMPAYEAQMMDQRIVAENKRRQAAIMRRLDSSSRSVLTCVNKKGQRLQGSRATLLWMIEPDGRVSDTAIKTTDIEDPEIQKCIQDVAAGLDFSSAKTDLLKRSRVEYTYKFKVKQKRQIASIKKKKLKKSQKSQWPRK
ncbi:MAG: hypothetical protein ACXWRE_07060 [Pseudobdellovibrionaceae bacterium]